MYLFADLYPVGAGPDLLPYGLPTLVYAICCGRTGYALDPLLADAYVAFRTWFGSQIRPRLKAKMYQESQISYNQRMQTQSVPVSSRSLFLHSR